MIFSFRISIPDRRYNTLRRVLNGFFVLFVLSVIDVGAQTAAPDFQSLFTTGISLYDEKRFDEAESVFHQAVDLQPKSADAHYWLGMTYYERSNNKEAVKQFRAAIRRKKQFPEAYIGLGRTYMRIKNRMVDARQTLKEALKYDNNNAQIYYYLGISYMEQSKRDPAAPLYVRQARKAFQQATANNPQHPDAYYQLGLSFETPSRDYEKALSIFYRQLSVNPGHRDAVSHLGRCCFLTGQYREGVDLLTQLIDMYGEAMPKYAHTLVAQLNASYLQSQKRYEEAGKVYGQYLGSLNSEERRYYTDLVYVASEEEYMEYDRASEAEQTEIRRKFWASRDPDPATIINERLVEHYRRVMHSREHYARVQQPWDRRGDIYIRYGEPDDLQHFIMQAGEKSLDNYRPTGDARIDVIRERNYLFRYRLKVDNAGAAWGTELNRQIQDPDGSDRTIIATSENVDTFLLTAGNKTQAMAFIAESWVYMEHDMEMFFVDQLGIGNFDYPLGTHETNIDEASIQSRFHPKRMAEELIKKTSESYAFDYGGDRLDFLYDMVTYKGEGPETYVEIGYVVPSHQLGTVSDGQGLKTWLNTHVVFRDDDYNRMANVSKRIGPIERSMEVVAGKKPGVDLHTAMLDMNAPAGSYLSAVEVRDEATRRIGIFEQVFTVPDYDSDSLMISDIKLAMSITPDEGTGPFIRHGLKIEPNPARLYQRAEPVHFYYEIYNLAQDAQGRALYQVELEVTTKERRRNIIWKFLAGLGELIGRSDDEQSIFMVFENRGLAPDEYSYTSIDTGESPIGTYAMTLRIKDLHSGQTVSKTKNFVVTNDRSTAFSQDEQEQPIDMQLMDNE